MVSSTPRRARKNELARTRNKLRTIRRTKRVEEMSEQKSWWRQKNQENWFVILIIIVLFVSGIIVEGYRKAQLQECRERVIDVRLNNYSVAEISKHSIICEPIYNHCWIELNDWQFFKQQPQQPAQTKEEYTPSGSIRTCYESCNEVKTDFHDCCLYHCDKRHEMNLSYWNNEDPCQQLAEERQINQPPTRVRK